MLTRIGVSSALFKTLFDGTLTLHAGDTSYTCYHAKAHH